MLQNLPESNFYDLLPQGVINLDQRHLIQAVVGGFQDRVADLRTFAGQFAEFVNPAADFPQLEANVILVTYTTVAGRQVTTSLDFQPGMPAVGDASALETWAAGQLKIDQGQVRSAVAGTDLLRRVDIQILNLLAANLGAVLYGGLRSDETALERRERAQRIVRAYFPQLKIKGTVESFSTLGRLIGFADVAVTPLWTRLSPRDPSDFGAPVNDPDFSVVADELPSPSLPSPRYDPLDPRDGEYFTWTSGPLVVDPDDERFYLSVNRRNPFIALVQTGVPMANPPEGEFILSDGGPNLKAKVVLSAGTHVSNLTAEALIEGEAYNGLRIVVAEMYGSARALTVTDQLSLTKYRSSWFDMAATASIEDIGTVPVQPNADLEENPAMVSPGVAIAPFRPWFGGSHAFNIVTWPAVAVTDLGTRQDRLQAAGTNVQQDPAGYAAMQTAAESLEAVRPATRQIRRKGVGQLIKETSIYAATKARRTIFEATGAGSFGAIVPTDDYPAAPYGVAFSATVGTASQAVYADQVGTTVAFAGPGFAGTYDLGSNSYEVNVEAGTFAVNGTLETVFEPAGTEVVRAEPSREAKLAGTISYQARPEDQAETGIETFELFDEYPWRRQLLWVGGEDVDLDIYLPPSTADLATARAARPARVVGENGVQYDVLVIDAPRSIVPFRYKLVEVEISDPTTGLANDPDYAWPLLATTADNDLHHVVAIETSTVAQGYWNPARTAAQALWAPLNDHPVSKLQPAARGVFSTECSLLPAERSWDAMRGWHLTLGASSWVQFTRGKPLVDTFTLSFYLRPVVGATDQLLLQLGGGLVFLKLTGTTLTLGRTDTTNTATVQVALDAWNFIVVRQTQNLYELGVGTYALAVTWNDFDATGLSTLTSSTVKLVGGEVALGFHDLGLWTDAKSDVAVDMLRRPRLVKTVIPYPSTWVESVNRGARFTFELVPEGGFAYPASRSLTAAAWRPGYALRYDRHGLYVADAEFKQVGLGDGYDPQALYPLGLQGVPVEGAGYVLVTGSNPPLGWNDQFGTTPGSYISVTGPYGSNGGVTTVESESPTPSSWPSNQMNTNPAVDRVYVLGDTGSVYQVYLDDVGDGPELRAVSTTRPRPVAEQLAGVVPVIRDEPTDFHTVLSSPGRVLSVMDYGTATTVYAKLDGTVTRTSPPFYLYRQTVQEVSVTNAFNRWSNPNADGQELGIATRRTAGVLQFDNVETLAAGNYLIEFDVGNIGTVDADFDGFDVGLSIINGAGNLVVETVAVLLPGGVGTEPRGATVVSINVAEAVTGPFLLTLDWTNDGGVPSKGQMRQLAVYAYSFRRVSPQLYEVSLSPGLTIAAVDMGAALPAGGLFAEINSYGTAVTTRHEALVFPAGSAWPLSNLLTGSTDRRREWVRMITPYTLPDPAVPASPSGLGWTAGGTAPYQFGDAVDLTVDVVAGSNLRYVWSFWDGLTEVSYGTNVQKIVTAGTGPFDVTVTAVNEVGAQWVYTSNLAVNQPPTVEVSASPDYEVFPYTSSLSAIASDPEGSNVSTAWYEGVSIFASGTNAVYLAEQPTTLAFKAVDPQGGVTVRNVVLSGLDNLAPVVSSIRSLLLARISSTNEVQFAVLAQDPENRGLAFEWTFWDGTVASGTTTPVDYSSAFHNVVIKALAGASPGLKLVTLRVTDGDGRVTIVTRQITLIDNVVPTIVSVKTPSDSALAGTSVPFTVIATDDDGDTLSYVWDFTAPAALTLYGGNVLYPTNGGQVGATLFGTVMVDDANGGIVSRTVPQVILGSVKLDVPLPLFAPSFYAGGILQEFTAPIGAGIVIRYRTDNGDLFSATDGLPFSGAFVMFPESGAGVIHLKAKAFSVTPGVVASDLFEGDYTFFDPQATA